MKRVLIFSLAYYPRVGGAEIAIKEITERILDIEFHMVTLRFSSADLKDEKIGNVFVHRIGNSGSYLSKIFFVFQAAFAAKSIHTKERFDGAWAMMSYMTVPIVLLRLMGVKLPYVLTLQEGDTYDHMFHRLRVLPFLPFLSYGFRHASVVQTISTFLGTWARKRGFRGRLKVVPNGVDLAKFMGAPIPHEGTVIITSSRLVHKNAIDVVIRALAQLPESIRFKILGTGPEETMLRSLARTCGVEKRVEFAGHIDHTALPKELHAADIFVRPSRSEGMGNSFVEAMAAGLPVIATQEGGIADFLFDAKRNPDKETTGWAVEKDNPEEIVAAMQTILGNSAETARVVKNAQELAVKYYSWDLIAAQMRDTVFGPALKTTLQ
jgi:glycosyltransferase involved in cell wall biosynthesis